MGYEKLEAMCKLSDGFTSLPDSKTAGIVSEGGGIKNDIKVLTVSHL
jgi:hypothetical protein